MSKVFLGIHPKTRVADMAALDTPEHREEAERQGLTIVPTTPELARAYWGQVIENLSVLNPGIGATDSDAPAPASTPAALWRVKGEPDPHGSRYDCERAALAMGSLTDDELANGAFLNYDQPLDLDGIMAGTAHSPIAWMEAVKDRIRWLSRQLAEEEAANNTLYNLTLTAEKRGHDKAMESLQGGSVGKIVDIDGKHFISMDDDVLNDLPIGTEIYTRSQAKPGAWEPSGIEYDRDIHHNPDAMAWAELFIATFPNCGADKDLMVGWFANAMMAMYDHVNNKHQPKVPDSVVARIEKHALPAGECPRQSKVVLLASLSRIFAEQAILATLEGSAPVCANEQTFQSRVNPWLLECFGEEIANDLTERNHRFLEEALELAQATGCTMQEAHKLVDYVFSRPIGEVRQEVGGVMVTLAAHCLAHNLDMHEAGEAELARISQPEMIVRIREKQKRKPSMSPLPGVYPDRVTHDDTCCCGETEASWRICPIHHNGAALPASKPRTF